MFSISASCIALAEAITGEKDWTRAGKMAIVMGLDALNQFFVSAPLLFIFASLKKV